MLRKYVMRLFEETNPSLCTIFWRGSSSTQAAAVLQVQVQTLWDMKALQHAFLLNFDAADILASFGSRLNVSRSQGSLNRPAGTVNFHFQAPANCLYLVLRTDGPIRLAAKTQIPSTYWTAALVSAHCSTAWWRFSSCLLSLLLLLCLRWEKK